MILKILLTHHPACNIAATTSSHQIPHKCLQTQTPNYHALKKADGRYCLPGSLIVQVRKSSACTVIIILVCVGIEFNSTHTYRYRLISRVFYMYICTYVHGELDALG